MNFYLFGYPVSHSLSPLIHNTGFNTLNMNHHYELGETQNIAEVITTLRADHTGGGSITIPHKETIIPYLDTLSPEIKDIGAVNTVVKKNQQLIGYNTDWLGIRNPIVASNKNFRSALVIGAGGAARAVCYALNQLQIPFAIYNRTVKKAEKLAQEFNSKVCEDINQHAAELIISTIPTTENLTLNDHFWTPIKAVFDIVYKPYFTPLLAEAKQKNIHTIHGIEMLLAQAYEQFQIWTMHEAPQEAITKAVFEKLDLRKR